MDNSIPRLTDSHLFDGVRHQHNAAISAVNVEPHVVLLSDGGDFR
jgi:hypothetical protein